MKKFILLALFFTLVFAVFGQSDWALFPLGQRSLWAAGDEAKLHFCDSAAVQPDGSTAHFFGQTYFGAEAGASCFDSMLFAIKGLTRLPIDTFFSKNGVWSMRFLDGQTLAFFVEKTVGEGWAAPLTGSGFDAIEVNCIEKNLGLAIEEKDSVKIFEIRTFQNGQPVASGLDGEKVVLSQRFGLLDYPKFESWTATAIERRTLIGFESGGQRHGFLHRFADYLGHFAAGQVYKYRETRTVGPNLAAIIRRDSIVAASMTADGVNLTVYRQSRSIVSSYTGTPPNVIWHEDTTFFYGVAESIWNPSVQFQELGTPDWFNLGGQFFGSIKKGAHGGWDFGWYATSGPVFFVDAQKNCQPSIADVCFGETAFNSVFGKTYLDLLCLSGPAFLELIGFKSDGLEWGDFQRVTAASEAEKPTFGLAPNPTDGPLFLTLPRAFFGQKVRAKIVSATGQTLRTFLFDGLEKAEINATGLPSGPYFLLLRSEKGAAAGRFWLD